MNPAPPARRPHGTARREAAEHHAAGTSDPVHPHCATGHCAQAHRPATRDTCRVGATLATRAWTRDRLRFADESMKIGGTAVAGSGGELNGELNLLDPRALRAPTAKRHPPPHRPYYRRWMVLCWWFFCFKPQSMAKYGSRLARSTASTACRGIQVPKAPEVLRRGCRASHPVAWVAVLRSPSRHRPQRRHSAPARVRIGENPLTTAIPFLAPSSSRPMTFSQRQPYLMWMRGGMPLRIACGTRCRANTQ